MKVIIIGGGNVGEAVAKMLKSKGDRVTVVDKDQEVCERLARHLEIDVVKGDATQPLTLEEARVEEASAVIALTGDDLTNVISALLAERYGVPRIIARVENPNYAKICEARGIRVISPDESASIMLEAMLYHEDLVKLTNLLTKGGFDVEYIDVDREDMRLSYVLTEDSHPVMIIRENEVLLPKGNLKLKKGDRVFIIRKRRKIFTFPIF
ncbi:hypothetical protein DRN86_02330 [Candidatus Geothermarchaeota archaeon]|nr:MAG: hypothetical protein DRN86_02330 [Candidatus Geothermarchaeota archaeon]